MVVAVRAEIANGEFRNEPVSLGFANAAAEKPKETTASKTSRVSMTIKWKSKHFRITLIDFRQLIDDKNQLQMQDAKLYLKLFAVKLPATKTT